MAKSVYRSHLRSPADFGVAIQQARMTRGLTQADLAAEVGISQSAISEIENGKSTIHLRRLLALARATGIEFAATWEDGPERDRPAPGGGSDATRG